MTLSNIERQQDFQRHRASRGLSVTAELLVKTQQTRMVSITQHYSHSRLIGIWQRRSV